jgi:hypothetical protein
MLALKKKVSARIDRDAAMIVICESPCSLHNLRLGNGLYHLYSTLTARLARPTTRVWETQRSPYMPRLTAQLQQEEVCQISSSFVLD